MAPPSNQEALLTYVRQHLLQEERPDLASYLAWFQSRFGQHLRAVLFYGSCLHASTKTATSIPDFYVVVDGYGGIALPRIDRLLSLTLPPLLYFLRVEGGFCKYNLLSKADLERVLRGQAGDIYNLGRLSKRFGVLFADPATREEIVAGYLAVADRVLALALPLLPQSFSLEELIRKALSLSYLGERRVEADDKVERLFQAERDFYRTVFEARLCRHCQEGLPYEYEPGGDRIVFSGSPSLRQWAAFSSRFFLWQSRVKTYLRWPKYALTIEGWVDYLLAKVERAKGIRFELSEKERRYPLIYGWKYLWELKRKGHFH